ncbi:lipopolysaccharide biosynthesis protein [Acinetobacter wanghuae]|uniref:lipopolysaccharide biosynthesis protein n=1 Tax=Acinetobacter wanghuae TaxID=2662362 RepID=UPI0012953F29|nr:lipopolysaccharide biosynthesis protein [Acinetobacter wanghuae]
MNLINSVKWVLISQISKILCQVAVLILLARLMLPSEYGLIALASIIVALGMLFRDMGTSAAIIQKNLLNNKVINAVFLLNMLLGILVCAFLMASAQFFSAYFSQEKLSNVIILLSLTFPILSLATTQKALMERESDFKKLAFIECSSIILSTMLCILTAVIGGGVYSIVVQAISNALISTILIVNSSGWSIRNVRFKDIKNIKELVSFSGNLFAFNLVNYSYRNADKYIIGKNMTTTVLGAYDLSYKIMLFPIQTLTSVLSRAFFPAFSKLQNNDKAFKELFTRNTISVSLLSFPMLTGLMALREDFVSFTFGKEWLLVSSLLLWLCPVGMIQALGSSTGSVLMAKGRTDVLFRLGCFGAFLTILGFFVSIKLSNDIIFFSQFYLMSNSINFIIATYVVCRVIGYSFFDYFFVNLPILIASVVMFFILSIMNNFLPYGLIGFIFKILLGMFCFLIILFIYSNKYINDIFEWALVRVFKGVKN